MCYHGLVQDARRKWTRRWVVVLCSGLIALALLACRESTEAGPEQTLRLFLRLMDRSAVRSGPPSEVLSDEEALRAAYELLSADTQAALRERADLAASLAGGEFEPWNILIPGRFRLRFEPRSFETQVQEGTPRRARVRVRGANEGEVADVMLVEERGQWRVPFDIPPAAETSF